MRESAPKIRLARPPRTRYQQHEVDSRQLLEASKRLLSSDFGEAPALEYLEALRRSVNADRSYVFEFHRDHQDPTSETLLAIVRDLPEADRDILEPQSILSLLVCPIFVEGEVWGFVGFDDCQSEREWTRTERSSLANGSRALAAALRHRALKQRLAVARSAVQRMIAAEQG